MTLMLGVDTGGTYTDAVLIRGDQVVATAKSLTTRQDLAVGIGRAVQSVLATAQVGAQEISLASLSTTLATNALVEGQGGRVALVYIGFSADDLERHGLNEALKGDPALVLGGGHNHAGAEVSELDKQTLLRFLEANIDGVSGFALASVFATRNPAHEVEAARIIAHKTGLPVTCSHHLSSKLNGPKRAVTAVLNARLVGMIDRLINRAEDCLRDLGVQAPMMVVRGDGALMSAHQARSRPIETILSGPAASIVGARWMTGAQHALVSDIGGTTTDVALIERGLPKIDPAGAQVGKFRTMVEAVAMRTTGLGGDSQVHALQEGLTGGVSLGPRRVLPVSLLAREAADTVHAALDVQLNSVTPGEFDGQFARGVQGVDPGGLSPRDATLFERIGLTVQPLGAVMRTRLDGSALMRLVDRGLVQLGGITPSDASHVLGTLQEWDAEAAYKAFALFARKRVGTGKRLAQTPEDLAHMIVSQLTDQTALALLTMAFSEDEADFPLPAADLARHVLTQKGLEKHRGVMSVDIGLNVDVIGLGASAATYYPAVGTRLNCPMILPEHAAVANAIGAVVGQITQRQSGAVTVPSEGVFRVHGPDEPRDFSGQGAALQYLEQVLTEQVTVKAQDAGAAEVQVAVTRDIRTAQTETGEVFIEARLTVEASGRPRVAHEDVS